MSSPGWCTAGALAAILGVGRIPLDCGAGRELGAGCLADIAPGDLFAGPGLAAEETLEIGRLLPTAANAAPADMATLPTARGNEPLPIPALGWLPIMPGLTGAGPCFLMPFSTCHPASPAELLVS